MPELLITASPGKDWKRTSAELSVMSPWWLYQSRDWAALNIICTGFIKHNLPNKLELWWSDVNGESIGHRLHCLAIIVEGSHSGEILLVWLQRQHCLSHTTTGDTCNIGCSGVYTTDRKMSGKTEHLFSTSTETPDLNMLWAAWSYMVRKQGLACSPVLDIIAIFFSTVSHILLPGLSTDSLYPSGKSTLQLKVSAHCPKTQWHTSFTHCFKHYVACN